MPIKPLLILRLAVSVTLVSCAAPQQKPSTPQAAAVPSGFVKAADGTLYAANAVPAGVKVATVPAEPTAPVTAGGRKKFWTPERRETVLLALMGASSAASSYYNAQAAAYSAQAAASSAQAAANRSRGYGYVQPITDYSYVNPYSPGVIRMKPSFGNRWSDQNGMGYRIERDPLGISPNGTVYKVTALDGTVYRAKPTFTPGQYKLEPQ
jgi:hypothetical protein